MLRHYNCISFDVGQSDGSTKTEKILESAYDISCESPSYGAWTAYASFMLFVYPIGIPFLYWVLLFQHRTHINPDVSENPLSEIEGSSDERPRSPSAEAYMELRQRISLSRQDSSARNLMTELLGHSEVSTEEIQERKLLTRNADPSIRHLLFLFEEYEPRCYQFVVFECVRKLALTGLLIFVFAGSATQIAIGLLIAVLSEKFVAHFRPYIDDTDDNLANVGNTQIILVPRPAFNIFFVKDHMELAGIHCLPDDFHQAHGRAERRSGGFIPEIGRAHV